MYFFLNDLRWSGENTMSSYNPLLQITPVEKITGIKRKTLRRWWEQNKFPRPTDFNGRLYWRENVVNDWLDSHFGSTE